MKIYLLIFLFAFLLSGCSCNHQELYLEMQDYVNTNGETCLKYVENDTLLIR